MFPLPTFLFIASLAFSQTYTVTAFAGSDWIGDGGLATQALLFQAEGIVVDSAGNLYVADAQAHRIRQVSPSGMIRTFAGTGTPGFSGDGGPASAAQLHSPYGLALDSRGNLYIADLGNGRVRRVGPDGRIETVASAPLISPRNLATDGAGNLFVSDFEGRQVYRLGPDGNLAPFVVADLRYPTALAVDRSGALYIADSGNHLIRKFDQGRLLPIVAAVTPTGLALDASGALYIADSSAGQILKIPPAGLSSTIRATARDLAFGPDGSLYAAGGAFVTRVLPGPARIAGGGNTAYGDSGAARDARLNRPAGIAADTWGNVYIADRGNHRIRRVGPDGVINTVAGTGAPGNSGDNGLATLARLNQPTSVRLDPAGDLLIADTGNRRVRKFTPGGILLPLAETVSPVSAAATAGGDVYIADADAHRIYWAAATGVVVPLIGDLQSPGGVALDRDGNLYYTDTVAARVWRRDAAGALTELGAGRWSNPRGLAVAENGDVFVSDAGLRCVLRVDSSGSVTALQTDIPIGSPWDVAIRPGGKLYVADPENDRVWTLTPVAPRIDAVNAASMAPGPLAPGMLVAIRGAGPDLDEILFAGFRAPVLAADDSRIVVQAPLEIAGKGQIQIEVRKKTEPATFLSATVADAAPALFTNGSGQAAAVNEDGFLNSAEHPVPQGGWISLYGTGEGIARLPVAVSIGGYAAEVLYSSEVAACPGLFQINVRVPAGYLGPGTPEVVIVVGDSVSPPGVTIAVK